jgi:hypothetical protein
MGALPIGGLVRAGKNVIAVRLVLTKATDGLLDLVKLCGNFSVDGIEAGRPRITRPRGSVQPASWSDQGYPWYSGRGVYRRRFTLPDDFSGLPIRLEANAGDDAVQIVLNGEPVGIRLWPPYEMDITETIRPGENELEIRVANTLINQLEAVPRPSGLSAPPRLVPFRRVEFSVPE